MWTKISCLCVVLLFQLMYVQRMCYYITPLTYFSAILASYTIVDGSMDGSSAQLSL